MSFGLSHGRDLHYEGYGYTQDDLPAFDSADPQACRVDPRQWFEHHDHPLEIEIGSGKGTFLVQQAPLKPNVNYLGIEWAGEFFRYAADRMRRHALHNVRMLHTDATQFLRYWCKDALATVIHLYFSDPWPKKKHHKRRVVQDQSLLDIHRVLAPGGQLRLVTDHANLQQWYEDHAARHTHLFQSCDFAATESADRGELVGTNYERKFALQDRPFFAQTLVKIAP